MQDDFQMYSNKTFANVLTNLVNDSGYSETEISNKMKRLFGTTISDKQLKKYMSGTAVPKADSLYLLANFFNVQIDALVGRCDIEDFYYTENARNKNKFHLNTDSRYKLSNMENKTEIYVMNKIITDSNLIETFTAQMETATIQLQTTPDKEIENAIITFASNKVQVEIDKLFRKCLHKYNKR